jgi:hypothetical protein
MTVNARRKQSGYLLEIPLIMAIVGMALAIVVPKLPGLPGKVLVAAGALVWIGGLFYMIVMPGWQPGNAPRLRRPWSLLVFLGLALLIGLAAGAMIFGG